MHDQHLMLDIETLGVTNDSAVFAVGVIRFDLDRIFDERLWLIDLRTAGGRREPETIAWWETQDKTLRDRLMAGTDNERQVLQELRAFVLPYFEDAWTWGDPANFDYNILQSRYREQGIEYPFNWRNIRCAHTLQHIADELKIDYSGREVTGLVKHDPLSDCRYQAYLVQIVLKKMRYQFDTREPDNAPGKPVWGDMNPGA